MRSNEHTTGATSQSLCDAALPDVAAVRPLACSINDLRLQGLRVLRCTARALASSPGGLRFKAGTRPWLDGLEPCPAARRALICSSTC